MKIQIRRGVFETNSSSVHTLTIKKTAESVKDLVLGLPCDVRDDIINNGIKFGRFDSFYYAFNDSSISGNLQNFYSKVDELYEGVLYKVSLFAKFVNLVREVFEEAGIKYEINDTEEYISNHEGYYCGSIDLISEILDTKDTFISYLFCMESNLESYDRDWYYENHKDLEDSNFERYISNED